MKTTIALAVMVVGIMSPAFAQPSDSVKDHPPSAPDNSDAKIAQLSKPGTTLQDVIQVLGEPQKYLWGQQTFEKNNLPTTYIANYPRDVQFVVSGGRVTEIRCEGEGPDSGFTWHGQLHLGSSLEEVFKAVGPPSETVAGKPLAFSPGVFYRDIDDRKGFCAYARPEQHVRFFFRDDKIVGLYVTLNEDDSVSAQLPYETTLSPAGALAVVRRPAPYNFDRGRLESVPAYDPKKARTPFQVDLRSFDLSGLKVSDRLADLLHANFDSKTRWPATLPAGFDPAQFMELGKNPGLRVRELHAKGVTGKGVGLGIIDLPLLVDHLEYRDRLRLYEEIHTPKRPAEMHGAAVASIAVGRTVGVAPESDLYYIADYCLDETSSTGGERVYDFTWLAKSIDRLLEINARLPKENRIRVISISVGWSPGQKGYQEVMVAVERAKKKGVFVISTALEETHSLAFHGLGRQPADQPDSYASFGPGLFWAPEFWDGSFRFAPSQRLLVPMDSRCLASPTGPEDYVFYSDGGLSWSVPWIAGLYALACQVDPDITPEEFWAAALRTGQTTHLHKGATRVDFGTIVDPAALIKSLQRGQ